MIQRIRGKAPQIKARCYGRHYLTLQRLDLSNVKDRSKGRVWLLEDFLGHRFHASKIVEQAFLSRRGRSSNASIAAWNSVDAGAKR